MTLRRQGLDFPIRSNPRGNPHLRVFAFSGFLQLAIALSVWGQLPVWAAGMNVSISWVAPARGPTLVLSGLEPGRYAVQACSDLLTWTELSSGAAVDGIFRHQYLGIPGDTAMFFRGMKLPDAAGPEVVAVLEPGAVAAGLITPAAGGSLTLTNRDGTRFVFTVAPSNVVETVPITMSVVSEFTTFPSGNSERSAVVFAPDGFAFHGAGRLEIQFPVDKPPLKLSSFAFDGNGKDFHLVPDLTASNRVVIPVTHFSGVGTAVWEPAGRAAVTIASIQDVRDRYQAELGGILSRERQNALLGANPQTNVGAEILLRAEDYFRNHLEPSFAEAERDCVLAKFLIREILGLAREGELLGWPDGPAAGFFSSGAWEKWQCNCLTEAFDACAKGTSSNRNLARTVLGFARESQLTGNEDILATCGLGTVPEFLDQMVAQKLPCLLDWVGVASYADIGNRRQDCSRPETSYACSEGDASAEQFEVEVDEAEIDEIVTPFFTQQVVTLTLRGDAMAAITSDKDEDQWFECGATTSTRWRTVGTASQSVEVRVQFSFLNGNLTTFTAAQMSALPVELRTVHSISKTFCGGQPDAGGTQVSESSLIHDVFAREINLQDVSFTQQSPGEIEGNAKGTKIGANGVPQSFFWTFHLRRKM